MKYITAFIQSNHDRDPAFLNEKGERTQAQMKTVAGGSGCPRELRSRTRVQKAAQVARRMGRSLSNGGLLQGVLQMWVIGLYL